MVTMRLTHEGATLDATNGHQTVVASIATEHQQLAATINLNDACLRCIATARDDEDVTISVARKATKKQETFDEGQPTERTVDYFCDVVSITLERARLKFDVRSFDVLPPNAIDWDSYVEFQRSDFDQMVRLMGGVADEAEYNWNMSGISLAAATLDGRIEASATDGRRIGVGTFPAAIVGDPTRDGNVIPRSLLKIVKSIDSDENVLVSFTDRSCFIRIGDVVCEGAIASGRFPNTAGNLSRMDTEGVAVGTIDRQILTYGLKLTAITTSRPLDAVGVRLRGLPGAIWFSSEAPDRGKCHIALDADVTAKFDIVVDPSFVLPVLSAMDEQVELRVLRDESIQVAQSNFRYLVAAIQK